MTKLRNASGSRGLLARRVTGGAVVGIALLVTSSSVGATSPCFTVKGHYDEHLEANGCQSAVQFCIAGQYQGSIEGNFSGAASSFIPTADTATTGVLAFTADV